MKDKITLLILLFIIIFFIPYVMLNTNIDNNLKILISICCSLSGITLVYLYYNHVTTQDPLTYEENQLLYHYYKTIHTTKCIQQNIIHLLKDLLEYLNGVGSKKQTMINRINGYIERFTTPDDSIRKIDNILLKVMLVTYNEMAKFLEIKFTITCNTHIKGIAAADKITYIMSATLDNIMDVLLSRTCKERRVLDVTIDEEEEKCLFIFRYNSRTTPPFDMDLYNMIWLLGGRIMTERIYAGKPKGGKREEGTEILVSIPFDSTEIMAKNRERRKLEEQLETLRKQITGYINQDYRLSDPQVIRINQKMNAIVNKLMGIT